jgi:tryptophan synthase beta chain
MKLLGASVVPVTSGSMTLKDATNEAMRNWICNPVSTHYIIGSVVGPHPFPDMVAKFHSIISEEMKSQFKEKSSKENPDYVIACVGGGSNAMGIFYHYLDNTDVKLIGVEAAGHGVDTQFSAATTALGKVGVLHGSKTLLMQTSDGQVLEAHSISAGLDYPGIGPQHAHFHESGRVQYVNVTDDEAVSAALLVSELEGIIPALETAHAFAYLPKLQCDRDSNVVVCLSGRGDKDLQTFMDYKAKHSL